MSIIRPIASFILAVGLMGVAWGDTVEESELLECGWLMRAPTEKNGSYVEQKYAPDRRVDILHVAIDITPDFKARTIKGVASIRFAPIARGLEELSLDA